MKKSVSFLMVCMVLFASSAFANDNWLKPMIVGTVDAIMLARQHNISKDTLNSILSDNLEQFNKEHQNDKQLIWAYNRLHKIDKSIVEDAYTFPIGKTIAEKDAICKTFNLRWKRMLDSTM